jgi:hypothetical protein
MMDKRAIIQPTEQQPAFVEVRGPSGRLYGRINPHTLVLEVKRKGEPPEVIDLRKLLEMPQAT